MTKVSDLTDSNNTANNEITSLKQEKEALQAELEKVKIEAAIKE